MLSPHVTNWPQAKIGHKKRAELLEWPQKCDSKRAYEVNWVFFRFFIPHSHIFKSCSSRAQDETTILWHWWNVRQPFLCRRRHRKKGEGTNVQEKPHVTPLKTAWPQTIISRLSRFYADGVRRHDDDGDDNNGCTLKIPDTGRKEGFNLLVGAWVKVGTNGRKWGGFDLYDHMFSFC